MRRSRWAGTKSGGRDSKRGGRRGVESTGEAEGKVLSRQGYGLAVVGQIGGRSTRLSSAISWQDISATTSERQK